MTDPTPTYAEAQSALLGRPGFNDALMNADHAGHRAAMRELTQLHEQHFDNSEPVELAHAGNTGVVGVTPNYWGEPTPEEMRAQAIEGTTSALVRKEWHPEQAAYLAQEAADHGMNPVIAADLAEAATLPGLEARDTEHMIALLGGDASLLAKAQKVTAHFKLSAQLLGTEIGGIPIGDNPHVVRALARVARQIGL